MSPKLQVKGSNGHGLVNGVLQTRTDQRMQFFAKRFAALNGFILCAQQTNQWPATKCGWRPASPWHEHSLSPPTVCRVSIDDFGTGYSSLSYLKRFKVDKLKIDQSFVRDLARDPEDAAIVRAITQMAKSLNLRTVAEGVENAHIAEQLRVFHCDEVQRYHFARPMAADAFALYLADQSEASGLIIPTATANEEPAPGCAADSWDSWRAIDSRILTVLIQTYRLCAIDFPARVLLGHTKNHRSGSFPSMDSGRFFCSHADCKFAGFATNS